MKIAAYWGNPEKCWSEFLLKYKSENEDPPSPQPEPEPEPEPEPPASPTPPLLHRSKNGLQQHLTRENRSDPYLTGRLGSHNRRNPHLTRIFRDVCVSKSSRSPPYAAARNFCTLKIFYRPACSIFGAPKFSTCDMKNFKARPIELLGRVGTPHIL